MYNVKSVTCPHFHPQETITGFSLRHIPLDFLNTCLNICLYHGFHKNVIKLYIVCRFKKSFMQLSLSFLVTKYRYNIILGIVLYSIDDQYMFFNLISTYGQLSGFYFFLNKFAMNTFVHTSFYICTIISSGRILAVSESKIINI